MVQSSESPIPLRTRSTHDSHVTVHEDDLGLAVATFDGAPLVADTDLAGDLRHEVDAVPTGRLVIDLTLVRLDEPGPLLSLLADLDAEGLAGSYCVVCDRLSGRSLLARWGITAAVAVFATLGDARQAHVYTTEGFGSGWQVRAGV